MHGGLQQIEQAFQHRHVIQRFHLADGHEHAAIGTTEVDGEGPVGGKLRGDGRLGTEFFAGRAAHVEPRFERRVVKQRKRAVREKVNRGAGAEDRGGVREDDRAFTDDGCGVTLGVSGAIR